MNLETIIYLVLLALGTMLTFSLLKRFVVKILSNKEEVSSYNPHVALILLFPFVYFGSHMLDPIQKVSKLLSTSDGYFSVLMAYAVAFFGGILIISTIINLLSLYIGNKILGPIKDDEKSHFIRYWAFVFGIIVILCIILIPILMQFMPTIMPYPETPIFH